MEIKNGLVEKGPANDVKQRYLPYGRVKPLRVRVVDGEHEVMRSRNFAFKAGGKNARVEAT